MRKTLFLSILFVAAALVLACGLPLRAQEPQGFFVDPNKDLGDDISTDQLECCPVFTHDRLVLFFTRWTSQTSQFDIFMATRENTNDLFGDVVSLDELNTDSSEVAGSLFKEGNGHETFFFYSTRPFGLGGDWNVYTATRANKDEPFGDVQPLSEVNTVEASETEPFVTEDGLMLLFTSNSLGTVGGIDIFVTRRDRIDEPFDAPMSLEAFFPGSDVNSAEFAEFAPELSSDRLALFFSDFESPPYRGGDAAQSDLWVSTRPGIDQPFGTPVNLNDFSLGSEINTAFFEKEPSLSPDWPAHGSKLYFKGDATASGEPDDLDISQSTWVTCRATRTVSAGPYFPGETVSVNLNVKKVPEGNLEVTETVPAGLSVTNTGGGIVSASGITFDFNDSAQVTYELTVPEDFGAFTTLGISGAVVGDTDCNGDVVHGDSAFHTIGAGDVAPWTSREIGEPTVPGGARLDGGDLFLAGGGGVIAGTGDKFHLVYQAMTGDGILTTRIRDRGLSPEDGSSTIGVMLREDTDALGAKHASMLLKRSDTDHDLAFVRRRTTLTRTTTAPDLDDSWVRIERSGNEFIGYHSTNGIVWTELGRDTIDDMPATVLAGIALTAASDAIAFANVTNIRFGPQEAPRFIRGDGNGDGRLNIADPSYIAGVIFGFPVAPATCEAAVDSNGDSGINIADASYVANYLFGIAPATPPPAPYPDCAPAPAEEPLGCLGTMGRLE